MSRMLIVALTALVACQPPPAEAPLRVVEIYMHSNGLSRCVEEEGERWKADASCCPDGFELAGFSVPAVTEYVKPVEGKEDDLGVTRRLYRHVVCMERRAPASAPTP